VDLRQLTAWCWQRQHRLFEVRRVDIERFAHAHLDRNELGEIVVTAGLSSLRDHALVSLLALNGLRVSEAIGANIEAPGLERGHRTPTVVRKGGKLVTMPLAPHASPGRSTWPSANVSKVRSSSTPTVDGSTGTPPTFIAGAAR
jgi:integrase